MDTQLHTYNSLMCIQKYNSIELFSVKIYEMSHFQKSKVFLLKVSIILLMIKCYGSKIDMYSIRRVRK